VEAVAAPEVAARAGSGVREHLTAGRAVAAVTIVWAAGLTWLSRLGFEHFQNRRFDLGNMTQAVWSTAHGHPLEVTEAGGQQISRLSSHVDPILVALAPLWWLWSSPLMLLTLQVVALAAGVVPVFLLARKHLPTERAAANLALAYLFYPALEWRALNDFHPTTLAVPLLLFAIWFLDEGRFLAFAAVAIAAAATQEQIGLLVAGLGVWYAVRTRRFRVGALIAAPALLWSAFAIAVVIPHFAGVASPHELRYAAVGGSPAGILRTLVTDPLTVLGEATHGNDLRFLYVVAIPLLGVFLLSPGLLLVSAPQLALPLLSGRVSDTTLDNHLYSPVIPFVMAAAVYGVARTGRHAERIAKLVFFASALTLVISPVFRIPALVAAPTPREAALTEAVALIPATDAVSATNHLGSRLSARERFHSFPVVADARWIVVDSKDDRLPPPSITDARFAAAVTDMSPQKQRLERSVARIRASAEWDLVFSRHGVLVWHRRGS